MSGSRSTLKSLWVNLKYLVYTVLTLAIVVPVALGLWWLTQIFLLLMAAAVIFFLYKLLNDTDD